MQGKETKAQKRNPYDTPALRQFTRFKAEHPSCVLFFRMGDFYEMFGDDAVEMSRVLGLTLSERPKGVPLAGVPHHQLSNYLKRTVDAGYRVAICDQIQDPKDAKGVVERAVTRVVTAGTLVDESLLTENAATVAAVVPAPPKSRFAWAGAAIDLSTGAFTLFDAQQDGLAEPIARLAVRELCYPEGIVDEAGLDDELADAEVALTPRAAWQFREDEAHPTLCAHFAVKTLEGFGIQDSDAAIPAAGALLTYLIETQTVSTRQPQSVNANTDKSSCAANTKGNDTGIETGEGVNHRWAASGGEFQGQNPTLNHLRPPSREDTTGICRLDAVSLRALEVVHTIRNEANAARSNSGSLLGIFTDSPGLLSTPMGKRLLREWLCRPLADAGTINDRLDRVDALAKDREAAQALADALNRFPDLARIAGRVSLGRATPRDLVATADAISRLNPIVDALTNAPSLEPIALALCELAARLGPLADQISTSCVEEAPATLAKGGLIRDGVDAELDEARGLQRDAGAWLAEYQSKLNDEFDLPSLKVGYNKVFGYYIELPAAQARRAPDSFTRKQTLKNAERYITPELKAFEEKVITADDRALARERAIFANLLTRAAEQVEPLGVYADTIAQIDVFAALASKAVGRGWVRPAVTDEPILEIEGGRHPVLDELLGDRFVPNDTSLGQHTEAAPGLALITGPNMAGKSTYIRQTALLTLLASVGSFIPATRATIGNCDRIFTRVGADDALHRGRSTFMVEMTETAAILNNATPRSLVILDEIGRGTSTLDGLSLAWAIAESLAGPESTPGPRTLFATHYHELTEIAERSPGRVGNLHVQVREWTNAKGEAEIVFVHRIAPGRADRSYGVHVARLAGVPASVTQRADEVLASLSVQDGSRVQPAAIAPERSAGDQFGLFTEFVPHPAVDRLKDIKLETLNPLQAFDLLRSLRDDALATPND